MASLPSYPLSPFSGAWLWGNEIDVDSREGEQDCSAGTNDSDQSARHDASLLSDSEAPSLLLVGADVDDDPDGGHHYHHDPREVEKYRSWALICPV